eukprot:g3824.t1
MLLERSRATHWGDTIHAEEVSWDFEADLDGWGNSTTEERDIELYCRGGELRGNIIGKTPLFDSPTFTVFANDLADQIVAKHYVVIRMMYNGGARRGRLLVRKGDTLDLPYDRQSEPVTDEAWASSSFSVDFDVINDGRWHIYYLRLWDQYKGPITQLRLFPVVQSELGPVTVGNTIAIDFVKIAKQPTIMKVRGCINKNYHNHSMYNYGEHIASVKVIPVHKHGGKVTLQYTQTIDSQRSSLPYTETYNCLPSGGERITIIGTNFGVWKASSTELTPSVTIDGKPCTHARMTVPEREISCISPPGYGLHRDVVVTNGRLPGLFDTKTYFSYARPPPQLRTPNISNVGATTVDLSWKGADDYWAAITITGYRIRITRLLPEGASAASVTGVQLTAPSASNRTEMLEFRNFVYLGNVTQTTILGLVPGALYEFAVAGMTEDQDVTECTGSAGMTCRSSDGTRTSSQWKLLDLYGRREALDGYLLGKDSVPTMPVWLRETDFDFPFFNANLTLNHGAVDKRTTVGPTGSVGGEGHYGINLVGDANIENCNASYACCDGFAGTTVDPLTGKRSTLGCTLVCSSIQEVKAPERYIGGQSGRNITTNALGEGIVIGPPDSISYNATAPCGGALRLSSSYARLSGAAWYPRQMNVREGFDTTFRFRIANPSVVCDFMDDVYTNCRSRGADGLAFVVQTQSELALGAAGMHMGYGGIENCLAVEFDTRFSYELYDPYENHVAVLSRGWRHRNSANHTYSFGMTTAVPDLTDGEHIARVVYDPAFDEELLSSTSFVSTPHMALFTENADWPDGGQADWSTGMGTLSVFVDDLYTPVLTVPMNLDATLKLNSGRAYVGFTAATGDEMWQTHDILSWQFFQARKDPVFFMPKVINGDGPHQCNGEHCVHY